MADRWYPSIAGEVGTALRKGFSLIYALMDDLRVFKQVTSTQQTATSSAVDLAAIRAALEVTGTYPLDVTGLPGLPTAATVTTPTGSSLLSGTHASRRAQLTSVAAAGSLFYETDRTVFYLSVGGQWTYLAGIMAGTIAPDQRPTDLTLYDLGFLYYDTATRTLLRWNGADWNVSTGTTPTVPIVPIIGRACWFGYFKQYSVQYGDNPSAPCNFAFIEDAEKVTTYTGPIMIGGTAHGSCLAGSEQRILAAYASGGDYPALEVDAARWRSLLPPNYNAIPILGVVDLGYRVDATTLTHRAADCDWMGVECYAFKTETAVQLDTRIRSVLNGLGASVPVVLILDAYTSNLDNQQDPAELALCQLACAAIARDYVQVVGVMPFSDGRATGTRDHEEWRANHQAILAGIQGVPDLPYVQGPPAPPIPVPTDPGPLPIPSSMLDIRTNFCGMLDDYGHPLFDVYYPTLSNGDRAQWRNRHLAFHHTHMTLCAVAKYPGQPWWTDMDFRVDPTLLINAMQEVIDVYMTPIVFLSSGDGGTGATFATDATPIMNAAVTAGIQNKCIWVPGFEVVGPGGGWTSKQLSDALILMHATLGNAAPLYVHLTPERPTGASHPVEDDDPWQGDEVGFWTSHGGEYLTGLLYQTPHGDKLLRPETQPVEPSGYRGYIDRIIEIHDRSLTGGTGWRQVRVAIFETIASDFFHACLNGDTTKRDFVLNRASQITAEVRRTSLDWIDFGNDV